MLATVQNDFWLLYCLMLIVTTDFQFDICNVGWVFCVFQAGAHNPVHPGQPAGRVPGGAGARTHQEPVPQVRKHSHERDSLKRFLIDPYQVFLLIAF
jgi:hypothetical protein